MFCCTNIIANVFFTPPLRHIKSIKRIFFVEDANNKKFILKYPRTPNNALHDVLGAEVGKAVGININDVQIFPPHEPSLSSVDIYPDQMKTVHAFVPGTEIRKMDVALKYFTLKGGLTNKAKLANITKHTDLYKIMALDIFLNNADRHNGNLFYDEKNNHYHAIDMDALFSRRGFLAARAGHFIKHFDKKRLSQKAKITLKKLYDFLDNLMTQFPPERLCELKKSIAAQAQYDYTELEQKTFQKLVESNFVELKRLQRRLARLLN
ncbi:MAG TPA: hypothetical protein VHX42_01590 [Candidatus Babeliales bacterium]|nr:hypothetical protein [Candidatus Babeliales bacterium]